MLIFVSQGLENGTYIIKKSLRIIGAFPFIQNRKNNSVLSYNIQSFAETFHQTQIIRIKIMTFWNSCQSLNSVQFQPINQLGTLRRSNVKPIFACRYLFDNKHCNYFFRKLSNKCHIFKIRSVKQKLNSFAFTFCLTFHKGSKIIWLAYW